MYTMRFDLRVPGMTPGPDRVAIRDGDRDGRVGRGQGLRGGDGVGAPRVARRLPAGAADRCHGDGGPDQEPADHRGRGAAAALRPHQIGRGDGRPRPPEPRSGVVHLRDRLPAGRVRALRHPVRGPRSHRRREAGCRARRVQGGFRPERERAARHAPAVHPGRSQDLVGWRNKGRGASRPAATGSTSSARAPHPDSRTPTSPPRRKPATSPARAWCPSRARRCRCT